MYIPTRVFFGGLAHDVQECLVAFGESIERRIKGGKGKVLKEVQGTFERTFGERLSIDNNRHSQYKKSHRAHRVESTIGRAKRIVMTKGQQMPKLMSSRLRCLANNRLGAGFISVRRFGQGIGTMLQATCV